jgi:hypothetical protein
VYISKYSSTRELPSSSKQIKKPFEYQSFIEATPWTRCARPSPFSGGRLSTRPPEKGATGGCHEFNRTLMNKYNSLVLCCGSSIIRICSLIQRSGVFNSRNLQLDPAKREESDPSERPEAHSPIVPEKWHSKNGLWAARLRVHGWKWFRVPCRWIESLHPLVVIGDPERSSTMNHQR